MNLDFLAHIQHILNIFDRVYSDDCELAPRPLYFELPISDYYDSRRCHWFTECKQVRQRTW